MHIAFPCDCRGLTIPTGPRPIKTSVKVRSSVDISTNEDSKRGATNGSAPEMAPMEGSGYLRPDNTGSMFGCCSIWSAAKHPVGRMSARRRRDVSGTVSSVLDLSMTNSVPPALGTRTYCACAPGRASDPNRSWWAQREVNPTLHDLTR